MPIDLNAIRILPAEPGKYFAEVAALMTCHDSEPTTEQSLQDWYNRQLLDGIQLFVAVSQDGKVCGFNGLYRGNANRERLYGIYLIVNQELRRGGIGSLLYDHLLEHAQRIQARTLVAWVRDNSVESAHFALARGFVQKRHSIEMMLDLSTWDDHKCEPILQSLRAEGFTFTNMAELGDTEDARRKLFVLNSGAAATDPGSDGIPPWASFEDFNRYVCQSNWYRPDAQFIAIDTRTGEWVAMSAITVFDGADHAYNLFTGTDMRYRGRKLAQAVKTLALRKARTYGVGSVRTSHTSTNEPIIAIDIKLGYVRTPGMLVMEKEL